ncbi:MAG: phosphoenolpyruvate--protein phosphotransferase [Spirochaetales bacterium]|nr:phosphoenolpyruvate--protein phosphotransferase [Spirochaetales bacterium]
MKEIYGISASPGIIVGKVFLYSDEVKSVPEYAIQNDEVDLEIERLNNAIEKAILEIKDLKDRSANETSVNETRFLDAHVLMLRDPELLRQIRDSIKKDLKNAEWIVSEVSHNYIATLKASTDEYLRERAVDIYDVSKRVLNHLLYRERISLSDLQDEVILVSHDILPSDTLGMNKLMVKGMAMDAGGKTSHTAILARSFEIPAVLGLSEITKSVRNGDRIIVDGNAGKVVVNPDEHTLGLYEEIIRQWQLRESTLLNLNDLQAETKDGKLILLQANIEIPEETDSVIAHGADGIGLYRSEFLFLQPGGISTEDEQYNAYSTVLSAVPGKPVTIRTLDIGGDKSLQTNRALEEKNPILGWRAIRFCLSQNEIFRTQLRALLRASVHGELRIMFPMISGIEEVDKVYEILDSVRAELDRDGIEYKKDIPIGIMIEVPSAALTSDILARKVDFFSIGTNDLIQYTIAVDRGNEKIAYLYEPFHPGVLRLIKMVIDNAHMAGIPVSMCGEMAGDQMAAVILLGLGLDIFSMSPFGIPEIKQIIRSVTMSQAEELVGNIMEMKSFVEVDMFVKDWMLERFDFLSR